MKIDLSARSWGRVVLTTVLGTLACVAVALYVDSYNFATMEPSPRLRALVTDIGVPLILAVPLFLFFAGKLRELAIANHKLTVFASTDSMTQVLNRAAFTTLVNAYLEDVRGAQSVQGALLIVDADHFKSINDLYGHDQGDEALISIAHTIRDLLHSPDIVGRLGGEEFGVFLPGASRDRASDVAETIRQSVSHAPFAPDGIVRPLSVSVGGAVFSQRLAFGDLFRAADALLYAAKRAGRDRTTVAAVDITALAA